MLPGALLSIGDPHASQGDSELCGTAIECSLTGDFQLAVHKKETLSGQPFAGPHLPAGRNRRRMGSSRPQLSELSGRVRHERAKRRV
ncbi:acetamidase/formamidase family protein [Caballeronia mineralivorans]|uniref:acetamidase/formamidase family protein n=1 Tax=Caballeronia mineralivorans TaxID=2010198 RepID=UPI0023EFFEC7|nr:acetamidase/formamidase family protein [Caballeronia mineralivorans]